MPDDLDSVFRREAGPCTATLIRILGDIDLAEDAVAEAFAVAAANLEGARHSTESRRMDHVNGPQPGDRPDPAR